MRKKTAIIITLAVLVSLVGAAAFAGQPSGISDIVSHWARQQIMAAIDQGIMSGAGDGRFYPDRALTRAELAVVLHKLFKLDYGDIQFIKAPEIADYYDDVPEGTWYAEAAMLMAVNKILPGDSREFKPRQPVTRLEVAQAINRCFTVKEIPVVTIMMLPIYEDTRDMEGEQAIAFVTNTGIMKGYNNYFRPHDPLTRAEAACVFVNTAGVIKQYRNE
ncbi:MAG: S-layer homology domain-containing protein [Syntrophomonadaceae bacterium]|nr:S-layer homology domain-containing protein [Syntrophomonadaceae bacterium]